MFTDDYRWDGIFDVQCKSVLTMLRYNIQVEVNEQQIRNLFIMNSGKFNFDFNWEMNVMAKRKDMVSITPMSGGVNHGERKKCVLSFCPTSRTTLRDSELTLKVCYGFHSETWNFDRNV